MAQSLLRLQKRSGAPKGKRVGRSGTRKGKSVPKNGSTNEERWNSKLRCNSGESSTRSLTAKTPAFNREEVLLPSPRPIRLGRRKPSRSHDEARHGSSPFVRFHYFVWQAVCHQMVIRNLGCCLFCERLGGCPLSAWLAGFAVTHLVVCSHTLLEILLFWSPPLDFFLFMMRKEVVPC